MDRGRRKINNVDITRHSEHVMSIAPLLASFYAQLAVRERLHPLQQMESWMECSHRAARAAADAAPALAPLCDGQVGDLLAAVERHLHADTPDACETTFAEVYRALNACCDLSLR
jgi:hypothetical protein